MTEDRRRLVFGCYTIEQFVFLIAGDDPPMTCPRIDHYGFSVGTEAELDDDPRPSARRESARRTRGSTSSTSTSTTTGSLAITVDLHRLPAADDGGDPVVGLQVGRRRTGDRSPVRGAFVPQGWKLEYTGWSAADAWARSVELARLADRGLGYDHLWVYDHVETVPRREPTHVFEAFTMLAALSQRTERAGSVSSSRARVTATPDCSPRRRPASTSCRAAA